MFIENLKSNEVKVRKVSIKDQIYRDNYIKRESDNKYYPTVNDYQEMDLRPNKSDNKVTPYISQLKKMRFLSKNMIEKIQKQNEKHREDLAECYQQIGRYNRLIIANNARNHTYQFEDSDKDKIQITKKTDTNLSKIQLNSRIFIYNELSFYLLVII